LRPGCRGCATVGYPVPRHPGHLISVQTSFDFRLFMAINSSKPRPPWPYHCAKPIARCDCPTSKSRQPNLFRSQCPDHCHPHPNEPERQDSVIWIVCPSLFFGSLRCRSRGSSDGPTHSVTGNSRGPATKIQPRRTMSGKRLNSAQPVKILQQIRTETLPSKSFRSEQY
jgi:hypothetical protein